MSKPLPDKINPCPIYQAFFEMRFTSEFSDEIPGMVFSEIRADYQKDPPPGINDIPAVIREQDPTFRFLPTSQYSNDNFILGLGDKVLNLACVDFRYPGGDKFKAEIGKMVSILHEKGIVREIDRIGMRYLNFFADENMWQHLNLNVTLNNSAIESDDLHLRTSFQEDDLTCVTQIAHPAFVKHDLEFLKGSLVDLDVSSDIFCSKDPEKFEAFVSKMHVFEKTHFYNLLSAEFLAKLNPSYKS